VKLYSARIPAVAKALVEALTAEGDIELGDASEAELDVQAVLKEYVRLDREVTEKAKDLLETKKLSHSQFGKIKRSVAEEKGFGLGEEAMSWIANQLLETFMHSVHVEEVFTDDAGLRRKMREVLKKHMAVDDALDEEVRQRIKNLEEGTSTWEIEYAKAMEQIKRKHGLE
jgi:uncharacterized protein